MALSSTERAKIRMYLGWQSRFYQTDSTLEQAMSAVDSDSDAVVLVQAQLTRLASIDTKLEDADKRQKLEVAEEIKFRGILEIVALRQQGRLHVGRLAAILGVPIRHDAYSPSAPSEGGGSFYMKLG